jgi:CheY-like chemotaxis protein
MTANKSSSMVSVLLIGFAPELAERLTRLLAPEGLAVDVVESPRAALEILPHRGFAGLVVKFPVLEGPARSFLDAVRHKRSPWRRAGIVAIACDGARQEAESVLDNGVNRVIALEDVEVQLTGSLKPLLAVAPRVVARVPSRVLLAGGHFQGRVLCQTGNLSATGMLLRLPPRWGELSDLRFELLFPGDLEPVRGHGRVVRQAFSPREPFKGVGIIFSAFEGCDGSRYQGHLGRYLAS